MKRKALYSCLLKQQNEKEKCIFLFCATSGYPLKTQTP